MTEQEPRRVMVISTGIASAAATVEILEAARAIEAALLVVDPEPTPMRLPILRGDELPFFANLTTGKHKAQWKQETYGRKRK